MEKLAKTLHLTFLLFEKCNEEDLEHYERAEYNKLRPTEIQSLIKGNYIVFVVQNYFINITLIYLYSKSNIYHTPVSRFGVYRSFQFM